MIIGIENVIQWLETNKTPYWYVRNSSGEKSSLMFCAKDPDDESTISLTDSVAKLRRCLDMTAPGNYFIQAWETPGQKKQWKETRFQITINGQPLPMPSQQSSMAGIGGVQDVSRLIEEALEKERNKNKIETLTAEKTALEKKVKELEAEIDSAHMRIGNRFDQVFGNLSGMLNIKPENNASSLGNTHDDTERIAQLMEKWAGLDADFESVLRGIVNLAENNQSKYQMGKNLLK